MRSVFLTLFLHPKRRFHSLAIVVRGHAGTVNAVAERSERHAVVAREGGELGAQRVIAALAKFL
jgi:hypothetical protein